MRRAGLLRVAAELPTADDRGYVVDVQADVEVDRLAVVLDDRDLAGLVVGAEPGAVWHADNFESHHWVANDQRLWDDRTHRISVGAVGDAHVLPIDEAIRRQGIGRRVQWSCQPLQRIDLRPVLRLLSWGCELHVHRFVSLQGPYERAS